MNQFSPDSQRPFQSLYKFSKGNRIIGIIIAVAMVVIGIAMFLIPLHSLAVIEILACIGLFIYGVILIVRYCCDTKKNGWTLVNGILNLVISGWIIILFFQNRQAAFGTMTLFLSLMLAFLALSAGIGRIQLASNLKKEGAPSTGWLTASGILDIVLAAFLIFAPLSITGIEWILGIYVIIAGIALFAECCTTK